MVKEEKTALEFASMIRDRLNERELRVAVYSGAEGWHATVYGAPDAARELQKLVNQVVQELRSHYDLA